MFFDEMRPPPARPGQFEEAVWPEDVGTGTDGEAGMSVGSRVGVWGGFEEVTLPDLEEDEESHKIQQISSRSRRRKEMRTHGNYNVSSFCSSQSIHSCFPHSCLVVNLPLFFRTVIGLRKIAHVLVMTPALMPNIASIRERDACVVIATRCSLCLFCGLT